MTESSILTGRSRGAGSKWGRWRWGWGTGNREWRCLAFRPGHLRIKGPGGMPGRGGGRQGECRENGNVGHQAGKKERAHATNGTQSRGLGEVMGG